MNIFSHLENYNDEEDRFQALCRAVMEYRGTMKEYCKAVVPCQAIDAFAQKGHVQAGKLLEQVSDMEDIINVGKLGEEMMSNLEPLTKLQVLYLKKLPNLKSVYWKAFPFPDVCRIFVLMPSS
ncbi:hypothetical protein CUMW_260170 [Citrus unshiu]|uniref:Uncharacterized protein n=1 Tax=Citrus unshiu TaxID=55188 RepID=A0A2H5QTJ5_CITUN|nr:hypothetical protein CUMW_260170 [Citrus unshiu]